MVSLDEQCEGAGEVMSVLEIDEDEGLEDDLENDRQLIRIKNILGYSIDYTNDYG